MKLVDKVSEMLNISKKASKKIIDTRNVFVNGKRIWIASHEIADSDLIQIIQTPRGKPKILYEDEELIIVDKPPGTLSTGPDSMESYLSREAPMIKAVHRLDKDTSGINIFAKTRKAYSRMLEIFQKRLILKSYIALVAGKFPYATKQVSTPLDGKTALTEFHRMAYNNEASLLSVNIKTGRTHQIRLHLKSLGFHLIGEKEYFSGVIRKKAFLEAPRQMLHAWKTRFPHPQLGEETLVTAPLPNDMLTLLQTLHLPPPS